MQKKDKNKKFIKFHSQMLWVILILVGKAPLIFLVIQVA